MKFVLYMQEHAPLSSHISEITFHGICYLFALPCSWQEALSAVEVIKPDFFLLDYHLPDINGVQLYDLLRAKKGLEEVPAIILYDKEDDAALSSLLQKRTCIGIMKPHDSQELFIVIEQLSLE